MMSGSSSKRLKKNGGRDCGAALKKPRQLSQLTLDKFLGTGASKQVQVPSNQEAEVVDLSLHSDQEGNQKEPAPQQTQAGVRSLVNSFGEITKDVKDAIWRAIAEATGSQHIPRDNRVANVGAAIGDRSNFQSLVTNGLSTKIPSETNARDNVKENGGGPAFMAWYGEASRVNAIRNVCPNGSVFFQWLLLVMERCGPGMSFNDIVALTVACVNAYSALHPNIHFQKLNHEVVNSVFGDNEFLKGCAPVTEADTAEASAKWRGLSKPDSDFFEVCLWMSKMKIRPMPLLLAMMRDRLIRSDNEFFRALMHDSGSNARIRSEVISYLQGISATQVQIAHANSVDWRDTALRMRASTGDTLGRECHEFCHPPGAKGTALNVALRGAFVFAFDGLHDTYTCLRRLRLDGRGFFISLTDEQAEALLENGSQDHVIRLSGQESAAVGDELRITGSNTKPGTRVKIAYGSDDISDSREMTRDGRDAASVDALVGCLVRVVVGEASTSSGKPSAECTMRLSTNQRSLDPKQTPYLIIRWVNGDMRQIFLSQNSGFNSSSEAGTRVCFPYGAKVGDEGEWVYPQQVKKDARLFLVTDEQDKNNTRPTKAERGDFEDDGLVYGSTMLLVNLDTNLSMEGTVLRYHNKKRPKVDVPLQFLTGGEQEEPVEVLFSFPPRMKEGDDCDYIYIPSFNKGAPHGASTPLLRMTLVRFPSVKTGYHPPPFTLHERRDGNAPKQDWLCATVEVTREDDGQSMTAKINKNLDDSRTRSHQQGFDSPAVYIRGNALVSFLGLKNLKGSTKKPIQVLFPLDTKVGDTLRYYIPSRADICHGVKFTVVVTSIPEKSS